MRGLLTSLLAFTTIGHSWAHSISRHQHAHHTPRSTSTLPSVLRGVNLGGWLVLEKWMVSDVFTGNFSDAVDQWTFDKIAGSKAALVTHWDTYINETDFATMSSWGLNAVRIPIGYWAYLTRAGEPYHKGADAYLEKAIGWAKAYGMKVLIDLHGVPGSQNGYDSSGRSGVVNWQKYRNQAATITTLERIAKKYATPAYADTVFAIELVNEPLDYSPISVTQMHKWTQNAFAKVQAASTNPSLDIIMQDAYAGVTAWKSVYQTLNAASKSKSTSRFWMDVHLYQNQGGDFNDLDQAGHITAACNWSATALLPAGAVTPVIVGEFSAQTNICVYANGTTACGTSCNEYGCQCSATLDVSAWDAPLVAATRMFLEAQLETFEKHARGWFLWSYKGPGAWGANNLVQYGVLGKKVTNRKYPGICKKYL